MDQTLLVVGIGTSVEEPALRALRDLPYRVVHVAGLAQAGDRAATPPAIVLTVCAYGTAPDELVAALAALAPAGCRRAVLAPRAWLGRHVHLLATLADELIAAEQGADEVGLRLAWMLTRPPAAAAREEALARRVLEALPRDADPETLLEAAARALAGLPGVAGVHAGWLGAQARPPIAVGADACPAPALQARALATSGASSHPHGEDRLVLLPLGAAPSALLALRVGEGEAGWAALVREELGRALDVALLLEARLERALRLERGYAERGRDLVRIEARLARVADGRDALLRFLSHDLRTPLTVLVGHCQMLSEGLLPAPRRAASFDTIRRQADRLGQMAAELLDRNRAVFEDAVAPEPRPLGALVAEAAERASPALTRQGRTIEVEGDPAGRVEADAAVLAHVLDVCIDVTVRRADDRAGVHLALSDDDGHGVLRLATLGPAWPGTIVEADATPAGRGLAAAAVRLRAFGGDLATAVVPGRAELVLTLPCLVGAARPPVLVIGAERDDVEALLELVAATGAPVTSDVFGPGLAAAVRHAGPAVLLLDATRDAAAALRALDETLTQPPAAGLPLVIVVPADAPLLAARARAAGAFAVITAPTPAPLLLAAVAGARRAGARVGEAFVARGKDASTGLEAPSALLARLPPLLVAAHAAGRELPALFVSGIAPRTEQPDPARAMTEQLVLWVGHELRTRAQPNDVLVRLDAGTLVLVSPARTRAEMVEIGDEVTAFLSRARPRIGVTRVPLQARLQVANLGWSGSEPDEPNVMGLRSAPEVGHAP